MVSQKKIPPIWLVALTAVSALAYIGLVRLDGLRGTLRAQYVPDMITGFLIAFAAYLILLVCAERSAVSFKWIWGGAILFRLILLFTTPTLSDDVYRYLWDGHVANHGVSPYAYAIESSQLDELHVPIRELANHTWMASPYQPTAQLLFFGLTAVFPLQPLVMQIAMVFFDLLAAWLLSRLLVLAKLPPQRLILYLWNPLVIVEVAHGAHLDAWMILLILMAIGSSLFFVHWSQNLVEGDARPFLLDLSPFFLALATLTKILPILLTPVFFWHWNWRQRFSYGVWTAGLLVPFSWSVGGWGLSGDMLESANGLFGAIRIYGRLWQFNSGIFHWLLRYFEGAGVAEPADAAKLIIFVLLALLLLTVWLLARTRTTPRATLRLMAIPFMGYVLLTPTLHPWYILILLAFLPFLAPAADEPRWYWLFSAPWVYLSGALIFSYMTYVGPSQFKELEWVRNLEWWPTLALLVVMVVWGWGAYWQENDPLKQI